MKRFVALLAPLLLAILAVIASPASAHTDPLRPGDTATTPTAIVSVNTLGGDAYVVLCATSGMVVSTSTWHSDEGTVIGGTYPRGATPLSAGECESGTLTFAGTPSTVTYTPDNNAPITWYLR